MSVVLGLLVALDMWSAREYFVLSCLGLLANRILFAPDDRAKLWWRAANGVTWLCLVALAYLLVLRAQ